MDFEKAVSDKSDDTYISFKRQIGAEKSSMLSILDTLKSRARSKTIIKFVFLLLFF